MSENPKSKVNVDEATGKRTFSEELEVAGNQLIERVQDLVKQGNVRRIIIRTSDDKVLFETSMTFGAVAGGVLALTVPYLAMLGALAAVVARVKIEIIREINDDDSVVEAKKKKISIDGEDKE
jgi:hypothetical protein